MPTIKIKNLVQRHNTWFVRMRVPDDVSGHVGRKILIQTTGESDLLQAHQKALPILRQWRDLIETARKRRVDSAAHPTLQPAASWLDHLPVWLTTTSLEGRQRKQYEADLRCVPWVTVHGLTRREVQRWVNDQTHSPKTIRRKLSAFRTYWNSMRAHGVTDAIQPFSDLLFATAKVTPKRDAFSPEEVTLLLNEASGALRDLIMLAAYSGARIEELCRLRRDDIEQNSLRIRESKTAAGIRTVPIHSIIAPLVASLRDGSADGWLIPSAAENQYGERSVPHGKKFGRLKSKLKFPPTKVFHSLRKTFATLLQDSGCPEHIAADILGHEIHTQTYGVYGKGSGIQTQRIWIEKAIRYPIPKAAARNSSGSPETA